MRLNGTQPNMKEVTTMQTMVPLYGFGGGSGGTGAALTVTAPAGATVTVSKDGKSKTKVADTDGVAVFKGLSSGDWLLSITDGTQTAQKTVTITADYTTAITFFAATIHITYPAGSTCTATDGTTTLTAPDTSGTWDCVVPNAGTWTVSLDSGLSETIDVTTSGETYTIDRWYLYNQGDEHEAITGGWTGTGLTKNADNLYLKGTDVYCHTANGVSTLGYASAVFEAMSKSTNSGGKSYVGFLDDRGAEVAKVQVTPGSEKKVVQVPLDAVQGTFKPYLWTQASNQGAYLYSVYLTI